LFIQSQYRTLIQITMTQQTSNVRDVGKGKEQSR
jgi:hypothetical protein